MSDTINWSSLNPRVGFSYVLIENLPVIFVKHWFQSVEFFFFSSRRRHTRYWRDWSSDVCSSDLRKYGSDHVAQIITFGTMLARAAIRDVGRVMGLGYGEVDRIAKAVPNQLGIRLSEALDLSPQLKEMHDGDPQIGKLVGLAQQLEGVARNASTHAAGVVISREPLTELMPLQRATNSDALMTQYEMHGVEALGLLKFDFLGLSNLTILRRARAERGRVGEERRTRWEVDH